MSDVVLVDRQRAKAVEYEEKAKWIYSILEKMKLPVKDIWPKEATMENFRKMRTVLRKFNVDLIDDADDGVIIYSNNELVAEWKRPRYKLVEDPTQKDVRYRFYYEMHLITNCIYDHTQENNDA